MILRAIAKECLHVMYGSICLFANAKYLSIVKIGSLLRKQQIGRCQLMITELRGISLRGF